MSFLLSISHSNNNNNNHINRHHYILLFFIHNISYSCVNLSKKKNEIYEQIIIKQINVEHLQAKRLVTLPHLVGDQRQETQIFGLCCGKILLPCIVGHSKGIL